ncbi:MAG: 2TM domain-containing protein [Actinomycetota bacterium]
MSNSPADTSQQRADDLWAWWSIWVLLGWGFGIAIHGLGVRLSRPAPSDA